MVCGPAPATPLYALFHAARLRSRAARRMRPAVPRADRGSARGHRRTVARPGGGRHVASARGQHRRRGGGRLCARRLQPICGHRAARAPGRCALQALVGRGAATAAGSGAPAGPARRTAAGARRHAAAGELPNPAIRGSGGAIDRRGGCEGRVSRRAVARTAIAAHADSRVDQHAQAWQRSGPGRPRGRGDRAQRPPPAQAGRRPARAESRHARQTDARSEGPLPARRRPQRDGSRDRDRPEERHRGAVRRPRRAGCA